MYILAIETATKNCSVALFKNAELVSFKEEDGRYSHAERLHVFIDEVLAESNIKYNQLSAIAVGEGPGSYTGLRIGLSAAKGFCYALNIPLIAVNTLETMILGASELLGSGIKSLLFCPMIDARRMEVYTMITDDQLKVILPVQPMVIDEECELNKFTGKKKLIYFGNGAEKCEKIMNGFTNTQLFIIEEHAASARNMGDLAISKYNNKDFQDIAYFEPKYLKQFMATTPKKLL